MPVPMVDPVPLLYSRLDGPPTHRLTRLRVRRHHDRTGHE